MALPFTWPLPALSGAWPVGAHDGLLKAAILGNEEAALVQAKSWLDSNDLDAASFRDHRLLVAVLARYGRKLETSEYYPRLAGLQRMLWTRTIMFLRDARPALAAIADEGIPILLIKGAARLADGGAGKSGRVAHDLDIVIRPPDTRRAFDMLAAAGWTPSSGASVARIRHEIEAMRALNMYKGHYGDIDLHAHAFHPGQGAAEDDDALWNDALSAELDGIPVLQPSPEDRIALSIAHGGLDAHNHSDWLVDIAAILREKPVSFDRLEDIVLRRGIVVPAAVALGYLARECQVPVDDAMLARLVSRSRAHPVEYLAGFLQARPRDRESLLGAALRGVAKHRRMKKAKRVYPPVASNVVSISRKRATTVSGPQSPGVTRHEAGFGGLNGNLILEAKVLVQLPPVPRRVVFEINTDKGHLGHGTFRSLAGRGGAVCFRITCRFRKPEDAEKLVLEARPRRAERVMNTSEDRMRYEALPFRLVDWSLTKTAAG